MLEHEKMIAQGLSANFDLANRHGQILPEKLRYMQQEYLSNN